MHFVLDANSFIGKNFGANPELKQVLSASSAVGYTVHVPQVVIEEVREEYARVLKRDFNVVRRSLGKLSSLTGQDYRSFAADFDQSAEIASFPDRLLDQLKSAEAEILEYPDVSHEFLVKSATSRRRPFNDKGSGYRDALIWKSVLELATRVQASIVLVSNDGDFRDGENSLHADLVEDLRNLGLPTNKVTLATDLTELVEKHVRPNLGTVPWDRPLDVLAEHGINLEDAIGLMIQDATYGKEWSTGELGVPAECESPTLDAVHDVSCLNVTDVRNMAPDQFLVKIVARIIGEFQAFMYLSDWVTSEDPRIEAVDLSWSDHYVVVGITLPLCCEVDFVFDEAAQEDVKIKDVSVVLRAIDE